MNSRIYQYILLIFAGLSLLLSSCFQDLDVVPLDDDVVTSAVVYDDPDAYKQVLAKLYAGLSVSGQQGPAGQPDISGIDEGFSTYVRQYWKAQELTTDEAVIAWNDGNIQDYHQQDWDAQNEFIAAMYNRIFYQISLVNEYLRETTDEKLDSRAVDAGLKNEIAVFRAEARFLRALSYWHALDMFRGVPFVTEADPIGSFFPEQASAQQLFDFIETELKEVESLLAAPGTQEYGRADQGAVWALLTKMYLNAETHIGQAKYTESIEYANKVINAGYTLEENYAHLFTADNDQADGIIFSVNFDGLNTKTWGGMTFVVHAAVGGSMDPAAFGIDGGWGGTRTTSALVDKFPAVGGGTAIVEPNNSSNGYPILYVPGSYQGWDPAVESTVIASAADNDMYEGYFWFDANTQFKLTDTPDWSSDWGDNEGDGILERGGGNIEVADAGFYRLSVNLNDSTYTTTLTNWGLIGSATPGGWDNDTDMTYDADEGVWTITLDLVAGEVKFRANDDWGLNYGDTGADAILEEGGDNIAIPGDGSYTIKLYLDQPDHTYSIERPSFDSRAMFYTDGQSLDIADVSQFTEGYAITKFTNLNSDGTPGSDPTFMDTDFPMFRLADVYLMYAEAVLRGGSGGDEATALGYVNEVRARAYGDESGNITQAELDLPFLLDERARELYWEGHRRTDLVRFESFSNSAYLWPWKGGVPEGVSTDSKYDIYPIPSSDLGANPNLTQNPGY